MTSAICVDLDQSKILLSGNVLKRPIKPVFKGLSSRLTASNVKRVMRYELEGCPKTTCRAHVTLTFDLPE